MKSLTILTLTSAALALPTEPGLTSRQIEAESLATMGITSNDFVQGGCNDVIFIWARGSAEPGNMGIVVGPALANDIKTQFPGKVAVQGIDYDAALAPNFLPGGTDAASIALMKNVMNDAMTQCPDSVIVMGGYSQGAAVNHRAIEDLPQAQKDRIAGVIMFGDTQKTVDNNQIPNFPPEKTMIICAQNPPDLVCQGVLTAAILPPHLSYGRNAEQGAAFIGTKVTAALAGQ